MLQLEGQQDAVHADDMQEDRSPGSSYGEDGGDEDPDVAGGAAGDGA